MKQSPLKAVLTAFFFCFGLPALALEPCGQVVVDTADVLKDPRRVEAAAQALATATGAEVRVRIAPDHAPEANLDRHVEAIADTVCTAWTTFEDYRRPNLVILWVTMNRQVGLYYGNQWDSALGRAWPRIKEQTMKPYLQRGDFDEAFVAALTAIEETIVRADAPVAPATPPSADVAAPAAPKVVVVEKEPVDYSKVYLFLISIGGLIVLVLLGRTVLRTYYSFREEEGKRQAEYDRALAAEKTAISMLEALNRHDAECTEALAQLQGKVSPEAYRRFALRLKGLSERGLALRDVFEAAPRVEASRQSFTEYKEMSHTYGNINSSLTELTTDFGKLRDELLETEQASAMVPEQHQALRGQVPNYWQRIQNMVAAGYKTTEAEAAFATADATLGNVAGAIARQDWERAQDFLSNAAEGFEAAATAAEKLSERKQAVVERLAQLREQLRDIATFRDKDARTAYAALERSYAKENYQSIIGNGSEAELAAGELEEDLERIDANIEAQAWAEAEASLEAAGKAVRSIEMLLMAIVKRERDLRATADNAIAEVAEAERSVKAARAYLKAHPEHEAPNHKEQLKRADDCIELAKSMLKGKLPNVEKAFEVADEADRAADAVYAAIKDGVDRVKAQKARLSRLSQELASSTDDLSTYLSVHAGDVGNEFSRQLDALRNRTRKRKDTDLASTITTLTAVLRDVEQLRADAHRTVSEAEAERAAARRRREEEEERRARRRRMNTTSSISRSSTSTFGGSSGFGGGSSSFGGSRGFGGGSSSW